MIQIQLVRTAASIHRVPGDFTTILAAGSCGAFVVAAEPVTIPLLQRAAAIDVPGLRLNAYNFMEGVNGISAAHAVLGGAAYAGLGAWRHDAFLVAVGAAVAVPAPGPVRNLPTCASSS